MDIVKLAIKNARLTLSVLIFLIVAVLSAWGFKATKTYEEIR